MVTEGLWSPPVSGSIKIQKPGTSLAVQWLGLCAFTAEGPGFIPGQGTKIPQAAWCGQKKRTDIV